MDITTSRIFPEIYLQYLDNTVSLSILVQHRIIGYFQCLNDILIVYLQITTNIRDYIIIFNNFTPTIHFTIKEDSENTINFLDITNS